MTEFQAMAGSWCCGGAVVGVLLIVGVIVAINWVRSLLGRGG